ncbi:MAG: hypothetical protein ACE5PO_01685, partial [Candidatus Bathyarchaeia archaeon]
RLLIKRGFSLLFPREIQGGVFSILRTLIGNIGFQTYVYARSSLRWLAHFTMFAGGIGLIVFHGGPRIFLGLSEEELFPWAEVGMRTFSHDAFVVLLLFGAALAFIRRGYARNLPQPMSLRNILPLVIILVVSVTGILAFHQEYLYAYEIGISTKLTRGIYFAVHMVAVYVSLVFLFWSKFFHWIIRLLAFSSEIVLRNAPKLGLKKCACCGQPYASDYQVEDVAAAVPDVDPQVLSMCPTCKAKLRVQQQLDSQRM